MILRPYDENGLLLLRRRAAPSSLMLAWASQAALSSMFWRDGMTRGSGGAPSDLLRASRSLRQGQVCHLDFLSGGYSHVERSTRKLPSINMRAFDKTPLENPLHSPKHKSRFRSVAADAVNIRDVYPIIYPMQVGWKKYGQCGVEITDWWPHLAQCADDIAWVRNMWTTDNDHWAENQIHTGRHRLDETQPSLGAWVHYGLGSLNDNLPSFVTVGVPRPIRPVKSLTPVTSVRNMPACRWPWIRRTRFRMGRAGKRQRAEQANEFELIQKLNGLAAVEYPDDERLPRSDQAYELPSNAGRRTGDGLPRARIHRPLWIDKDHTKAAGERLLCARRLVERGGASCSSIPAA
jgi:hypothetical protein